MLLTSARISEFFLSTEMPCLAVLIEVRSAYKPALILADTGEHYPAYQVAGGGACYHLGHDTSKSNMHWSLIGMLFLSSSCFLIVRL